MLSSSTTKVIRIHRFKGVFSFVTHVSSSLGFVVCAALGAGDHASKLGRGATECSHVIAGWLLASGPPLAMLPT